MNDTVFALVVGFAVLGATTLIVFLYNLAYVTPASFRTESEEAANTLTGLQSEIADKRTVFSGSGNMHVSPDKFQLQCRFTSRKDVKGCHSTIYFLRGDFTPFSPMPPGAIVAQQNGVEIKAGDGPQLCSNHMLPIGTHAAYVLACIEFDSPTGRRSEKHHLYWTAIQAATDLWETPPGERAIVERAIFEGVTPVIAKPSQPKPTFEVFGSLSTVGGDKYYLSLNVGVKDAPAFSVEVIVSAYDEAGVPFEGCVAVSREVAHLAATIPISPTYEFEFLPAEKICVVVTIRHADTEVDGEYFLWGPCILPTGRAPLKRMTDREKDKLLRAINGD